VPHPTTYRFRKDSGRREIGIPHEKKMLRRQRSMTEIKDVYTIQKNGEKSFWIRLGVAFVNKDGSLNVRLDGLPVNGSLHIRDRRHEESAPATAPEA
jgi:hypothetical protein